MVIDKLNRTVSVKDIPVSLTGKEFDLLLFLASDKVDMGEVNKVLVMQDITVMSSLLCNDTLEDYFKKITGGEGIA